MLSWWRGSPEEGSRDPDETQEPPETPGPVFAARALKSAFFGAPPLVDDTVLEAESDTPVTMDNDDTSTKSTPISPTKPPGILLTPGSAIGRRKTVSFGSDTNDGATRRAGRRVIRRSGLSNELELVTQSVQRTPLLRDLENARETKSKKETVPESDPDATSHTSLNVEPNDSIYSARELRPRKNAADVSGQIPYAFDDLDADLTLDINEPQSESGRFWKSAYLKYQEEAKLEMAKLLKYKYGAKDYAKMKDAEAIKLGEKLKDEKRRVAVMEDRVDKLVAQITGNEKPQALAKDLSRQTALATQYKSEVEALQASLEDVRLGTKRTKGPEEQRIAPPNTVETLVETQRELKKARKGLEEMAILREEVRNLKQSLAASEKAKAKLEEESRKTSRELSRLDERQKNLVEQRERRDEATANFQKQYDDLKERAKSQRGEAERLLKARSEQIKKLKEEITSLKAAARTTSETRDARIETHHGFDPALEDGKETAEASDKNHNVRTEAVVNEQRPEMISKAAIDRLTSTRFQILDDRPETDKPKLSTHLHSRRRLSEAAPAGKTGLLVSNTALKESKSSENIDAQKPIASTASELSSTRPLPDKEPIEPDPISAAASQSHLRRLKRQANLSSSYTPSNIVPSSRVAPAPSALPATTTTTTTAAAAAVPVQLSPEKRIAGKARLAEKARARAARAHAAGNAGRHERERNKENFPRP